MKLVATLLATALLLAACRPSDRPDQAPPPVADNRALAALFNADQAARKDGVIDLMEVMADAARLVEVRAMLKRGEVRSGADYLRAGLIFQHSLEPDDYLLAHALATAALSQGEIYGTQFVQIGDQPIRQSTLDRDLLTDAVRQATGVPPLAEQTPPPKP
ncbi:MULTISPECIES: hypothetical protein [unclassified Brevundimonas]|uniref:hypothetical protein n=1 Tax=unclassified Brevundimonas TaxID=2622653 RepID=UPI003F8E8B67